MKPLDATQLVADIAVFRGQFSRMFADPRFLQLDRNPQERAHERVASALSRDRYLSYLQRDAVREISGFLVAAVRDAEDLLHRTESQSMTAALRAESAERATFVRELFYLLWGPTDLHVRADRYFAAAKGLRTTRTPKAFTWPTATLLPWLLRPDAFPLLKPIPARAVAQRYGVRLGYSAIPGPEAYQQWISLCRELLETLRSHGAVDLLDVHSFLWRIHSPVV